MCSRHAPTDGADSEREWANPFDSTCDYCGRIQFTGPLHKIHIGASTSWECDPCWERTQQRYEDEVAS